MIWVIAAFAVIVLLAASFAAVGRFGAMAEPDTDTFRPAVLADPDAEVDPRELRFGRELRGYAPSSVDAFLRQVSEGSLTAEEMAGARFPTASPGYAMSQVDDALDRLVAQAHRDTTDTPDHAGLVADGAESGDAEGRDGAELGTAPGDVPTRRE